MQAGFRSISKLKSNAAPFAEDQNARATLQREELRAAIAAGLASGPGKSADTVFDRLDAKYRKMAGTRAAGKRAA